MVQPRLHQLPNKIINSTSGLDPRLERKPTEAEVWSPPSEQAPNVSSRKAQPLSATCNDSGEGYSAPCGSCWVCGYAKFKHRADKCMVNKSKYITSTTTGQNIAIPTRLNCKNFGVYVLTCTEENCRAQYISSTHLNFTKNISAQRGQFRQGIHSVCICFRLA